MSTNDSKVLIPQGSGSLSRIKPRRTNPIMQRMTRDILALLEEQNRLEQIRYTLDDYEFREPDYQQILRWAEAWGCSAEEVLERLREAVFDDYCFRVVDDCIHSLVWDCDQFSAGGWTWHEGLDIQTLAFISAESLSCLPINLPASLQTLYCLGTRLPEIGLEKLDLSPVPNLKRLVCWKNQLTELDLSPVPNLTELNCDSNKLTTLDLSPVPNLTELNCDGNKLTELDLSPVPNLTELGCYSNQLTELDLSPVPNLTILGCFGNQLTELDLSSVPNLTKLVCHDNPLTELDIRPLTKLEWLGIDRTTRLIGTPPPSCRVVSR